MDLRDLFRGRMSWRRLRVILANLPIESAYSTAVRDAMTPEDWANAEDSDRFGPWSRGEHLLARAVDGIFLLFWQQNAMHRAEGSPAPEPPEPVRRPGPPDEASVTPINSDAARWQLAYLRKVEELRGASPPPDWTPSAEELAAL